MSSIKLNFINHSNSANNSPIVIFQKNVASSPDNDIAVAWKVIKNCGSGESYSFEYPSSLQLATEDAAGTLTPRIAVDHGGNYQLRANEGISSSSPTDTAPIQTDIRIQNKLPSSSIRANVYRDGHLLAFTENLAPMQAAEFSFEPILYMGVADGIEEGAIIPPSKLVHINAVINLSGITSANIVMTHDAETGTDIFTLEDIVQ